MGWYTVVKKINGHSYLYRQTTWRENGKMKCKSIYLGRADGDSTCTDTSTVTVHSTVRNERVSDLQGDESKSDIQTPEEYMASDRPIPQARASTRPQARKPKPVRKTHFLIPSLDEFRQASPEAYEQAVEEMKAEYIRTYKPNILQRMVHKEPWVKIMEETLVEFNAVGHDKVYKEAGREAKKAELKYDKSCDRLKTLKRKDAIARQKEKMWYEKDNTNYWNMRHYSAMWLRMNALGIGPYD